MQLLRSMPGSSSPELRPGCGLPSTHRDGQGSVLHAWLMAGGRCALSHKASLTTFCVCTCKHTAMASWWPGEGKNRKGCNTALQAWWEKETEPSPDSLGVSGQLPPWQVAEQGVKPEYSQS